MFFAFLNYDLICLEINIVFCYVYFFVYMSINYYTLLLIKILKMSFLLSCSKDNFPSLHNVIAI